jgi:putative ABC transport system permease protein
VLMNDLRYATRLLRKSPLFTAAIVLTIAIGIGATTAIFSVVNAVLLRPLPFGDPGRLMQVSEKNDTLRLPTFAASVLNYLSWKERTQSFEQLGAAGFANFNLSGRGDPEQLAGSTMSPSLVPLLGVKPVAGRSFNEGEDRPGAAPVAMISEALWRRRFGADPTVVDRPITLNGIGYTLVGVAPASLTLLTGGDVWIPLTIDPPREIRLNHVILVFGRLKSGISQAQAQIEMNAVSRQVGVDFPEVKEWGVQLVSMRDAFVSSQLRTALLVLLSAVGFVLLIACANVANLLLARATTRRKEIAVRTAMGASRGRLLGQLLVESLGFSVLGGILGLAIAASMLRVINRTLPPNVLPIPDIPLDATVLFFAVATTLATGLLFGLAPAWQAAKADLNEVLKEATRGSTGTRPFVRNGLAAAELALATMLLIGAGLLVQSLMQLQHARLGFEPSNVLTFQVSPTKYDNAKSGVFYRQLLESLRALPGVRGAAVSSGIPFGAGSYNTSPMMTVGKSVLPPGTAVPIDWRIVSPGYFQAMNIPLVRGRDFTDADGPGAPLVTIVSRATAQIYWGDDDPIGRVIRRQGDKREWTVVGVAGDVRSTALTRESPAMYYPSVSRALPLMDVVVRTDRAPTSVLAAVRQRVRELDPELPLANVRTLEEWVSGSAAQPRLNAILLAVFAGVALIIAAIGIYGVLAYSVSQRTREIGLRMALGAQRHGVVRLIVREGMTLGLVGIGAGATGALALSRALTALVFGISLRDPLTYVVVAGTLGIVALAACSVPAFRASRVDPMIALRHE